MSASLTLAGTLAAQIIGYRAGSRDAEKTADDQRKQLDQTFKEQRDQLEKTLDEQRTRTLNERFATAAEQLGSDKPAVRLAGVYAMAGLADDWPESRQTCVDVLCGYLRMPYEPDRGADDPEPQRVAFRAAREVRHTVIRVISAHLREAAAVSWQGLDFDFTGTVFDGGQFYGAEFSGGRVRFDGAEFSGGTVYLNETQFSGAEVSFYGARFSGGTVDFRFAWFSGGVVYFTEAEFSGGTVLFLLAQFRGGSVMSPDAEFSGGTVDFDGARFSEGEVNFYDTKFSSGRADFHRAEFSGGRVRFRGAMFSGGTVDFSNPRAWSRPPEFPWADAPPPGVQLPPEAA